MVGSGNYRRLVQKTQIIGFGFPNIVDYHGKLSNVWGFRKYSLNDGQGFGEGDIIKVSVDY